MSHSRPLYLRPNVMLEALFNRWTAHVHLIPPAPAAMMLRNGHLPIMRNFAQAPGQHVEAMRAPELIGGPFLNLAAERAPEVARFVEETESRFADLLGLGEALKSLDELLMADGGEGLEALYPSVPERLKGYVELRYDLYHRATARLLEPLLYRSPYYRVDAQSIALSLVHEDERPFLYSTPRLPGSTLFAPVPFKSPAIDQLVALRHQPGDPEAAAQALGLAPEDRGRFLELFTDEVPRQTPRYDGPGLRVRYFGHACVLLETRAVSVLVDPVLSYEYPTALQRFTVLDVPPRVDYVLITHAHPDHLSIETLLQLRHRIGTVLVPRNNGGGLADPDLALMLRTLGFPDVRAVDDLETLEVEGGTITALPFFGEHGDLDIRSKAAWALRLGGRNVMVAADSNGLEGKLYAHLREVVGPLDALFLGMESEGAPLTWGYGPLFTRTPTRTMDLRRRQNGTDCSRAIPIVEKLRPRRVYNYAMGMEPWLRHLLGLAYTETSPQILNSNQLIKHCRSRGLHAERLFGQLEMVLS